LAAIFLFSFHILCFLSHRDLLPATDVCVQQSHAAKGLLPQIVNLCCRVTVTR